QQNSIRRVNEWRLIHQSGVTRMAKSLSVLELLVLSETPTPDWYLFWNVASGLAISGGTPTLPRVAKGTSPDLGRWDLQMETARSAIV
ncbi:MAG: hypothetical protein ACRCZF_18885, partial [Gemmataceae bacterium]